MEAIAVISTVINSLFVIVTAGVLIVNMRQVRESKRQAQASEDQVSLMRKQTEDSKNQLLISRQQSQQSQQQYRETVEERQRPVLVPASLLPLAKRDNMPYFDFYKTDPLEEDAWKPEHALTLLNVGTGIALNILVVIVEPRPKDAEKILNDVPVAPSEFVMRRSTACRNCGMPT